MNSDNFWDSGVRLRYVVASVHHLLYREFKTLEEWNPDPEIAMRLLSRFQWSFFVDICCQNAARRLYGHVNNLELYVGNSDCLKSQHEILFCS